MLARTPAPDTPLHPAGSMYGAAMGRISMTLPESPALGVNRGKVALRRVRLDAGGYDSGGAYWGYGQPLYWAGDDAGTLSRYFRASDRAAAKAKILEQNPGVKFYR